jgi:hypothetical protein
MSHRSTILWSTAAFTLACGGGSEDGRTESSASASVSLSQGSITTADTEEPTGGSGSVSATGNVTMGTASDTESSVTVDNTGDEQPNFDLGVPDGGTSCPEGDGELTHSFIWIANSGQGTVSKINTQTLVEEGRYIVRPDSQGNPSRTSVSLSGNVAVANRSGGVVKIYAQVESCQESNGMPGIQTSSGAADIQPWGTEECVAWYTAFGYATQRPVAWAQGVWSDATCSYHDEKLWTAGGNNGGVADVVLLDGDTGIVEDMVQVPSIGWAQLYGGAVDGDGNFWTVDHNWDGASTLYRVARADLTVDSWPVTGQVHYGLAVDSVGRAWLCGSGGASRFDPVSEMWTHLPPINPGSALGGCMEDADGILWNSAYPDALLVGIDTETVQIVQQLAIPEYVHGISIDFDGNVWGVGFSSSNAYRIDVPTQTIDTVGGLVAAYTYSDMTGFALAAAGVPSG